MIRSRCGVACFALTVSVALSNLVAPKPLSAQGCEDAETIQQCWDRLSSAATRAAQEEAKTEASDNGFTRLFEKLTGAAGGDGTGLGSAVSDFLPIFSAFPTITSFEESELGVTLETNLPLYQRPGSLIQPPNLGGSLKLRLELREPEVFAPLIAGASDAQRQAVRETLQKDLDQFDDAIIGVTWNAEGMSIGRAFGKHVTTFDAILASAVKEVGEAGSLPSLSQVLLPVINDVANPDNLERERRTADECQVNEDELNNDVQFDCFVPSFRAQLGQAIAQAALERREYRAAIDKKLRDINFFRLSDLLNNQPQFSISAEARLRNEIVGPNSYRFGVRYEQGFANVNTLRSSCPGRKVDASCLKRFLESPQVISALGRSDRFWAMIGLEVIDDFRFQDDIAGVPLDLAQGESISVKGSLGYGRQVRVDQLGNEAARLDFMFEGEINEDDAGRNDRFVASLTFTQKMSGGLSIPLGITYANKSEFITGVDDRLGVHIGVRWRLKRDPPSLPTAD